MTTNQTFGVALEAVKQGKAISREGWNGKAMVVTLNKGAIDHEPQCSPIEGIRADLFEVYTQGVVTRLPNLNMRAASGSTVTGWLASQTDLLAEDWCIHD